MGGPDKRGSSVHPRQLLIGNYVRTRKLSFPTTSNTGTRSLTFGHPKYSCFIKRPHGAPVRHNRVPCL